MTLLVPFHTDETGTSSSGVERKANKNLLIKTKIYFDSKETSPVRSKKPLRFVQQTTSQSTSLRQVKKGTLIEVCQNRSSTHPLRHIEGVVFLRVSQHPGPTPSVLRTSVEGRT